MNDLHFAVVTGINKYPGIETQLTSARSDARRFHEWLVDPRGGAVPEKQACFVAIEAEEEDMATTIFNAKPLRTQVNHALLSMHDKVYAEIGNEQEVWDKTRLYIYIAGHGVVPPAGRGALLFADSAPTKYWGDYLDLMQYELYYEKQYLFKEVILLADCCRETFEGLPVAIEPPFGNFRKPPESPCRVIGFATAWGRKAGEPISYGSDDSNGRGFFTRALLEGLRGKAADPDTGEVEIGRLATYVRRRVPRLAAELDYTQNAEFTGSLGTSTVLCTVKIDKYPVQIILPGEWTSPTHVVINGVKYAEWPRDNLAWNLELPNGIYEIISAGPDEIPPDRISFTVDGEGRCVSIE